MKTAASVLIVLGLVWSRWRQTPEGRLSAPATELGREHGKTLDTLPADMMAALTSTYTMKDLEETPTVVGDEYCIACHRGRRSPTRSSTARRCANPWRKNTLIDGKGVVADYDQNGVDDFMQGLDFNTISSVFDPYKPNAPILSYMPATILLDHHRSN